MFKIISFCKWCQDLPLPELAAELKSIGVDGVDLPCRPNAAITPEDAPKLLPEAKRVFEDNGLVLERCVTSISEANEVSDRQLEAIAGIGVKKIRIGGRHVGQGEDPRQLLHEVRSKLVGLQKLLEKHGIRGAIQNHSGNALEVNVSSTLRMLEDCDPEWVGVQFDPGHQTLAGEPFGLAIDLLGPYLHSVNIKSPRQEYLADPATGRLAFRPVWVPLKDGMLNVAGVLKKLKAAGYVDPISLHCEYRTHYYVIESDREATTRLAAEDAAFIRKTVEEVL